MVIDWDKLNGANLGERWIVRDGSVFRIVTMCSPDANGDIVSEVREERVLDSFALRALASIFEVKKEFRKDG